MPPYSLSATARVLSLIHISHPPTDLVQLRQTHAVGVLIETGIDVRNCNTLIIAGLNEGGADQNVDLAVQQVLPHGVQPVSYTHLKTVLHDINLYGRPGQKIAFVGSTGAGKTTCLLYTSRCV